MLDNLENEHDIDRSRNSESGPNCITNEAFGGRGAIHYDVDARRMARRYSSAHSIQNRLVILAASRIVTSSQPVFVDLGCGTATDALSILQRSRHIAFVGVDYSDEMLHIAKDKLSARGLEKRAILLKLDFRDLTAAALLSAIEAHWRKPNIFCVVSSLALHHYDPGEKREIYQFAHTILHEQGLLVLTDLYSNAVPYCANYALQRELTDVRASLKRIRTTNSSECEYPTTISEKHYIEENRTTVLSEEIDLLKEVGFMRLDVVFRIGQLTVITAAWRSE